MCESHRGCGTAHETDVKAERGEPGGGGGRKGLHEAVGEEVKLHGCTVAESAKVDFALALVTAGDTADEQQ